MTLRDFIPPERWRPGGKDSPLERSHIKRAFLVMMFADTKTMCQLPIYTVMKRWFPTVAEFLIESKREAYQELARSCQRWESRLMIDGACAEIIDNYPDAILVTVHDAILTQPRFVETVENAIRRQFWQLGIVPLLKRSHVVIPTNIL